MFPCAAWLGAGRGQGRENRELLPLSAGCCPPEAEDEPWELSVTTSDVPGAGLTAGLGNKPPAVCMRLVGPEGEAGPFELGPATAAAAADGVPEGGNADSLFGCGRTTAFVVDIAKGALGHELQQLQVRAS